MGSVGSGRDAEHQGWGHPLAQPLAAHQLSIQTCLFLYKTMFLFYTKSTPPCTPLSPLISALALGSIPPEGEA